jgi:Uma2 family endonuclease
MSDMAVDYKIHHITVDEFFQMGEAGVFEDRRVELLDGELVDLSPIGMSHAVMASRISIYVAGLLGDRAEVVNNGTLPLGEFNAPMPDIAIYGPIDLNRAEKRFCCEDAFALIEVADSSLAKDLRTKLKLYSRFRVPEYLVVDLKGRMLHHFTLPSDVFYKKEEQLLASSDFSLEAFPDVVLEVDRFLLPR